LPTPSAWPSRSACAFDTFGTGKIGEAKLTELVRKNFSLTPKGIIESLNLRRPIYQKTAAYGHFGRNEPEFTWEATDKAAALAEQAGVPGPRPSKPAPQTRGNLQQMGLHRLMGPIPFSRPSRP
jgi:hypothetical protein